MRSQNEVGTPNVQQRMAVAWRFHRQNVESGTRDQSLIERLNQCRVPVNCGKRANPMKSITWFGAILALLGIVGLAIPVFTTSQTKDVAKVGDLKIQSTEHSTHVVPLPLSAGETGAGLLMVMAGMSADEISRP